MEAPAPATPETTVEVPAPAPAESKTLVEGWWVNVAALVVAAVFVALWHLLRSFVKKIMTKTMIMTETMMMGKP